MENTQEQIPVYKYWEPVYSIEHFLLVNEIAQLWKLYSNRGINTPHLQLVRAILNAYIKKHNLRTFYYETRHGLKAVYSKDVYIKAYQWFLEETEYAKVGTININDRNYHYIIGVAS